MNENNSFARIKKAILLAKKFHAGQVRKGPKREVFFNHPRRVCKCYLAFKHRTVSGVIASLCHDLIEDTPLSIEKLGGMFGPQVRKMVSDLTKPRNISSDEYAAGMGHWSLDVRKIKLCDIEDNILRSRHIRSEQRISMLVKWKKYLTELGESSHGGLPGETEVMQKWSAVNKLHADEWRRQTTGSDQ